MDTDPKGTVQNNKQGGRSGCSGFRLQYIEPVAVLVSLAGGALVTTHRQYLYDRIATDLGYIDESNPNTTTECDELQSDSAGLLRPAVQSAGAIASVAIKRFHTTHLYGGGYSNQVDEQDVQEEITFWNNIYTVANIVPCFFTLVFLGSYSDRGGRKRAILPGIMGSMIRMATIVLTIEFNLPLWVLAIGEFFEGLSGGQLLVLTGTTSYIADVTTEQQRPWRMLFIELCGGFGSIVSEISLGFLISAYGFLASGLLALTMYSTAFLYVLVLIPETIQRAKHVRLFSTEHFRKSIMLLVKKVDSGHGIFCGYKFRLYRLGVIGLLLVTFFALYGGEEITTYYILNPPLCFDSIYIGFYRAFDYIIRFSAGILLQRLLRKRVGCLLLSTMGHLSLLFTYLFQSFATSVLMMFLSSLFGFATNLIMPNAFAHLSIVVAQDEQGSLFSLIFFSRLISVLVGSILFNLMYSATINWYRGFCFTVSAALLLIPTAGFIKCIFIERRKMATSKEKEDSKLWTTKL